MASDAAKDRASKLLKKQSLAPIPGVSAQSRMTKPSVSSVSHADEPSLAAHHGVKMDNTYQMGPAQRYPVGEVQNILKDVLQSYLAEERYEPDLCKEMSKTISEVVRARVKELALRRFKVVAIVSIGAIEGAAALSSRCVWDQQVDNYATYEFCNNSLIAQATVYGIYQE